MSLSPKFQELIQKYAEGRASRADVDELCTALRQSEETRRDFIRLMNLESALEMIAAEWMAARPLVDPLPVVSSAEPTGTSPAALPSPPHRRAIVQKRYLVAFAACLALFGLNFWRESQINRVHATVENGTGVRELPYGTQLRNEWIEIAGGTVSLTTPTAARIVIEAPAVFRFESPLRLNLTRGRMAADIPPSARKFTVVTPSGEAVDLGTKFGVDVPLRSEAEIHVFQGEVIAQSSNGGKRQNLHSGEAFQLKSGAGAARKLRSGAFIRPEEIDSLHAALGAGQPLRSDEALHSLRQDPSLIALLDFESPNLLEGSFDSVQGRWPGSRSAEFVQAGDHIRLALNGNQEWRQLTFAAWVRLNQSENASQSLLYMESPDRSGVSKLHWLVTDQNSLQLAIDGQPVSLKVDEPNALAGSIAWEQGRWVHLAAVYDEHQRRVQFFLNGRLNGEAELVDPRPVRLSLLEIGNSNNLERRLSGRIDELLLMGRGLSEMEIRQLYFAGNPYR